MKVFPAAAILWTVIAFPVLAKRPQSPPSQAQSAHTPNAAQSASSANAKPNEQPAEAVFKNIQVLTGQPASQVRDAMQFIAASLGVRCNFCHVNPWPSDVKEEKKTARKMIRMVFDINRTNFNSRPEVTCYTCHQGQQKPVSFPRTGAMGAMFAAAAKIPEPDKSGTLPTADELIARFERALGGEPALAQITTRVSKGTEVEPGEHPNPVSFEMKAAGNAATTGRIEVGLQHGTYAEGFDGSNAWSSSGQRTETLAGLSRMEIVRELELNPAAALRSHYTQMKVLGKLKIENAGGSTNGEGNTMSKNMASNADHDAYVLEAVAPDGRSERFYFDVETGLLLRRVTSYQTFLGAIPIEADYSDYRAMDGVKTPFTASWWAGGDSWIVKLSEVKDNVPLNAQRFAPPPSAPPAAK